ACTRKPITEACGTNSCSNSNCFATNMLVRRFMPVAFPPGRLILATRPNTTLADLFTLLFAANPFSAARASLRRWSDDEFGDGLAHGGQCRSRRRPVDSFFPALLF